MSKKSFINLSDGSNIYKINTEKKKVMKKIVYDNIIYSIDTLNETILATTYIKICIY